MKFSSALHDEWAGKAAIAWIQVLSTRNVSPQGHLYSDGQVAREAARLAYITAEALMVERNRRIKSVPSDAS